MESSCSFKVLLEVSGMFEALWQNREKRYLGQFEVLLHLQSPQQCKGKT